MEKNMIGTTFKFSATRYNRGFVHIGKLFKVIKRVCWNVTAKCWMYQIKLVSSDYTTEASASFIKLGTGK